MKSKLLPFLAGMLLTLTFAFNGASDNVDKTMASVQKLDGYYIFVKAEPKAPYEKLGNMESPGMVKSLALNSMLNTFIKKAKKDYPNADGLVFNAAGESGMGSCEVIKFK